MTASSDRAAPTVPGFPIEVETASGRAVISLQSTALDPAGRVVALVQLALFAADGEVLDVKEQSLDLGPNDPAALAATAAGTAWRLGQRREQLDTTMPIDLVGRRSVFHRLGPFADPVDAPSWVEEVTEGLMLAAHQGSFAERAKRVEDWPLAARTVFWLHDIDLAVGRSGVESYVGNRIDHDELEVLAAVDALAETGCARLLAAFAHELERYGWTIDADAPSPIAAADVLAVIGNELQPALAAYARANADALVRPPLAGFERSAAIAERVAHAVVERMPPLDASSLTPISVAEVSPRAQVAQIVARAHDVGSAVPAGESAAHEALTQLARAWLEHGTRPDPRELRRHQVESPAAVVAKLAADAAFELAAGNRAADAEARVALRHARAAVDFAVEALADDRDALVAFARSSLERLAVANASR